MATRAEVPAKIMKWLRHLKTTLGKAPAYLRCDNALEYIKALKPQLESVGTILAPVTPYSPEQNGKAERVNRTLGHMARTMLHSSELPSYWWSYAYSTASHLYNRMPNSKTGDKTPLELLYKVKPKAETLFPFGAKAIIHIPKERRTKLDERGQDAQLLGYPESGAGWMFWVPNEKRMIHSALVTFPEFQRLPVKEQTTSTHEELVPIGKTKEKIDVAFVLKQIVLKLGEEKTAEIAEEEKRQLSLLPIAEEHGLPKTIKQALSGPDAELWRAAAEYEMLKFGQLEVWVPVVAPTGSKALGARWVFSIKRKPDGSIDKYQARYVAKGFNQQLGLDYNETYAPTASLNILRFLISLSMTHNFPTATFDVSSAYLYSPIEEEVYIQPPVEINPSLKGKVMLLKKSTVRHETGC
jgi:hypothetical protein